MCVLWPFYQGFFRSRLFMALLSSMDLYHPGICAVKNSTLRSVRLDAPYPSSAMTRVTFARELMWPFIG